MPDLDETLQSVAQHYNQNIFAYESVRQQYSPVEFAITARWLNRVVPEQATVVDIGVGGGYYAKLLAQRGCWLYLIDISQKLIEATYTKLKAANLDKQVLEVQQASATRLAGLKTAIVDVVLLLGPLYHLCSLEARQSAVREASRILKPNGIVFAAGINRLAYFRELFRSQPELVLTRQDFHQQLLHDGNVDPEHVPPLGYAHFTTQLEFRQLLETEFEQIALIGTESFSAPFPTFMDALQPEQVEAWIDLVEETGQTPEGLGMTDHFLFIGKKRVERLAHPPQN
ncbi:MAG: methyltransferase domain-containing protein [Chroococcidiopsidaceae cyanobacterium CP_BM_ER_R8_30]|nr:methyltransferase domain-containing protein [Chroococcidiopsidaceae cyanobacterium CP_BM_ER_R8_30]